MLEISVNRLLLLVCGFIVIFDNLVFWDKLFQRIEFFEASGFGFFWGFIALMFVVLYLILVLFSNKYFFKLLIKS
jgi:uncharacterized membrane protein YecN with MAPEG domain